MVKIKLNKIVILSFVIMLLVCNITFADQKSDTYLTMQDFLNSIGIDVMDCTNIEYINVNTACNGSTRKTRRICANLFSPF